MDCGGPLASEIQRLLQDEPMFDFLCERTFSNHSDQGAVTLRKVAPMVQGILESAGRSVSSTELYSVWTEHCDPDMHQMALSHFKNFLRALLQNYVQDGGKRRGESEPRPVVTQASASGTWSRGALAKEEPAEQAEPAQRPTDPSGPVPRTEELKSQAAPEAHPQRGQVVQGSSPSSHTTGPSRALGRPLSAEVRAGVRAEARAEREAAKAKATPASLGTSARGRAQSQPKPKRAAAPAAPAAAASASTLTPSLQGRGRLSLPEQPRDSLTKAYEELPQAAADLLPDEGGGGQGLQVKTGSGIFTSMKEALKEMERLKDGLSETLYADPNFGPGVHDAGALPSSAPSFRDVVWSRPNEVWESHSFCGELAEVKPGSFGDAWFLGALCSLSLREHALFGDPSGHQEPLGVYPRLFWDPEFRRRGIYCFRFSKHGSWFYVLVDDRLPFRQKEPLFSRTHGLDKVPQIWAALIEKAYAKLHGSYFALSLGFVDDALEDLTSWPTEKIQTSKFAAKLDADGAVDEQVLPADKDPGELWQLLLQEMTTGTSLLCLRADSGSNLSEMVQVDPRLLHLEKKEAGPFCTGVHRNWPYPLLRLREVESESESLHLARLRSFTSGRWCGAWSDQDSAWSQAGEIAEQLQIEDFAEFLPACGLRAGGASRPQMPLQHFNRDPAEFHDGTFIMGFQDWLQVFSHVLLQQSFLNEDDWQTRRLQGQWKHDTCGGTPIPVIQPVLATPESWGRNPQCRITLQDRDAELCVTLHQQDARLLSDSRYSSFPFEEKLRQIFVCVMWLNDPDERLTVFDKKRIVRHNAVSAASLLSRRRSVSLKTRLTGPGSYVIVPSIWEPDLGETVPRLQGCMQSFS